MFYRFNQFTGRLASAAQQSISKSINPKLPAEPVEMMYGPGFHVASVPMQKNKPANRNPFYGEKDPELTRKQELFQIDNNVPVHLKGGEKDKFLFFLTLGLCGLGLEEVVRYFYESAFPKKIE